MKFLKKSVNVIFIAMFIYILGLLFFFSNMSYINERNYMINNIWSLAFILIIFLIFSLFNKKKDLSNKSYYKFLIIISFIVFGMQLVFQAYGYFCQTWDAGHLVRTVNFFSRYGRIDDMAYMTRYPNNSMLTFLLILIRSIPLIGNSNFLILIFNSVIVNVAGIFTSLTVRNLTKSNFMSLFIYVFLIPMFLLSPWILVYYSDTFASLFPIIVLYIYTKEKKDYRDYFFICFLSFLGFYIKPTVIIILIAIVITEILFNISKIVNIKKWDIKKIFINVGASILGILVVLSINSASKIYLEYYDVPDVIQFKLIHFMAMGLNEETDGIYNGDDVGDTMSEGINQNYEKVTNRLFKREFKKQINFFARKTLVNYNDGSFAWGHEGAFFMNVKESNNKLTLFIRNIILPNGKYNKQYHLIVQWLWLMILFFIPSIVKKDNNSFEYAVILSIIGISLFLTIFEARARYLYCYFPIYLVAFSLGIINVKNRIKNNVK